MNGFKDFFYKNNDIIIVFLILIVAAFLIFTRVSIIMEYPQKSGDVNKTQTVQETETGEDAAKTE